MNTNILALSTAAALGLANLFVYCYFGEMTIDGFENMVRDIWDTNWHELPIELQKYYIMMIQNMQRPHCHHYDGFGLATLDMHTFGGVNISPFKMVCIIKFINLYTILIYSLFDPSCLGSCYSKHLPNEC